MIRKALIATAALATLAAVSANQASAKIHLNGYINIGVPGYVDSPYYPSYPAYDGGYSGDGYYGDEDCGFKIIKKKKWSHRYHTFFIVKKKVWVCY